MDHNFENLSILQEVIAVLSRLDIPYALGGSWASSFYGKPRLTHDADVTVEPFAGKEPSFCSSFGEEYYVSLPAVQDAIRHRSCFNIIHFDSGFKVDLFVRKLRPFDASLMARRRAFAMPSTDGQTLTFVSAEDVILLKFEWYRLGGGALERQWEDILGVFQIQGDKLDQAYLDRWAADLGVTDLLQRARQESGV